MYEAGVQNDRLNLLHLLNQNALVVIKTSSGLTERRNISNVIMQGTVWGGMFCTTTMDKLGKFKYENPDSLFKYRGVIGVPALEMVDNIIDIKNCGVVAIKSNALVNSFIEHKKLEMGQSKCHMIHCGKKLPSCPTLKVHFEDMHNSDQEKYLGDHITSSANIALTISKQKAQGYGIIADTM